MFKRRLLASTMAVCFVTGFGLNAQASEPEHYFFPKNKWVVEQVQSGTLPTCTISNQLNNGYILQLAGTQDGFTNLNLDLRQDIFTENMKYEVTYSIPGQKTSIIPTKAFRKNLLVSDLRKKKAFGDALPVSSVVDVSVRGNEFRIYLTGLEAVMDDYNDCLGVDVAAEAREEKAKSLLAMEPNISDDRLAPPPPVDMASVTAPDENERIISEMPLPKHKLRPEPSSSPRYTEALAKKMQEESLKYKPNPNDMTPVDAQNTAEAIEPEASAPSIMQEKLAASSDRPSIQMHSETRNGALYNVETLSAPIVADMTSMDRVAEIEPASGAQQIEARAETLAQIEPTSGTPPESQDFTMMRDKISLLENQVNVLSNKNKMLDEELKSTLVDAREEHLSVSSNNWNLEAATMKFNEAERQIMRLGRQLQSQRAQCNVEKGHLEEMLFDPQVTDQQQLAKLSSLEAELETKKSELYRQQRQYEERIKILEQRLSAL